MNPAEFENIARAEETMWWYRGMQRILFRALDPYLAGQTVERVLEAGCGTGYFATVLEKRYRWRVHAIDLGAAGVRRARVRGLHSVSQADVSRLPFADAAFDAVFSMDVLPHFPAGEEDAPLQEMSRVLRPGGLLVLRAAAWRALRSRHSQFVEERQRYRRGPLARAIERHGVRVLRSTYANSFLLPVALFKFRVWEPLTRARPASGVGPVPALLNSLLHLPLALEAGLIGAGVNLPAGQSIVIIGRKQ
ncbi:MAG: class I SAM-dependent methyltransferase [Bryobacteraceae bacterium]|nr:class I SAM-dependent methyltransferase [Bryobacteraceae bacterium]